MDKVRIAIVGAGLSGLYAAYRLKGMGFQDYVVLEARDIPGGRIASFDASAGTKSHSSGLDRFDLGPTWFWPEYQSQLDQLVDALELSRFKQHEAGDTVIERSAAEAPMRVRGYVNTPESMRLVGGMGSLIDALRRELDPARILTGQTVRRLRTAGGQVELDVEDTAGKSATWRAEHVLLALPPRLAERTIAFEPPLPKELAVQWRETSTWMAPHAKYVAVYDKPFWREDGLSGEGRSGRGPLGEIHDASMPGGSAALFGFLGVPVQVRRNLSDDVLRAHCRAQLARLFGPQAATPKADFIKDWAKDPYTAVDLDLSPSASHHAAPPVRAASGPWQHVLTGIASEWSPQFPGYVAGAVEAAELGVRRLASHLVEPRIEATE